MLTNLDFLEFGQPWPPKEEVERIKRYAQNKQIFEGEHSDVYKEQFKRIERVIGNFEQVISYPVVINFQKLLSLKIADLLFGDPPKFVNVERQEKLDEIISYNNLINTAYEVALDVSRYGTGLFYLHRDDKGKGIVDVTRPTCWFPVVAADNIKKINYHVLAWTYSVCSPKNDKKSSGVLEKFNDDSKEFLKVQIHEKGKITCREYELDGRNIGKETVKEIMIFTGMDDFAVIPIHNNITSDRVYGIDDYADIDSIISELEVRIAQVSNILDKHSSPTMTGPSSALVEDENGNFALKVGNYIINDTGFDGKTPNVAYLTWDAQMNANFQQIEKLINLLYVISEMNPTLLDSGQEAGRAESGTALRLRMISTLAKINRIRMHFDPALKKAISLVSGMGWKKFDISEIGITWRDGLPNDPREDVDIMTKRTGNVATLSRKEAIKRLDDVDDEQAKAMVLEIEKEDEIKVGNEIAEEEKPESEKTFYEKKEEEKVVESDLAGGRVLKKINRQKRVAKP